MVFVGTPFLASADGGHGRPCAYDRIGLFWFIHKIHTTKIKITKEQG